MQQRTSLYW